MKRNKIINCQCSDIDIKLTWIAEDVYGPEPEYCPFCGIAIDETPETDSEDDE